MGTTTRGLYRHEAADAAAPVPELLNRLAESLDASWVPYTPAVVPESGALTTVTANSWYKRVGSLVTVRYSVTLTNAGTATGVLNLGLPFAATGTDFGAGRETLSTGAMLVAQTVGSAVQVRRYDNASMIASSHRAALTITYETSAA